MSRRAFLHVNGVNYELAYPIEGDEQSAAFQELATKAEQLASGTGGHQFSEDVLIEKARTRVHFTTQGVFAAGAFLAPEPKSGRVIAFTD